MPTRNKYLGLGMLLATVVAVQLLAGACGRAYYLTQLILTAYYMIVVLGLCLVMGYAGQVSLGHGAFLAIGGYTSAVLTTANFGPATPEAAASWLCRTGMVAVRRDIFTGDAMLSLAPFPAFLLGLVLASICALGVGYLALRLRGHYLAMATLGFGLIIYRLALGSNFTGAADGISGVPAWNLAGTGLVINSRTADRIGNYYFAWGMVIAVLLLLLNIVDSRVGRACRSIHGSEAAANAMGVNTAGYKLKIFVLSAILAAGTGSLLTHYYGSIGPSESGVMKSVRYLSLVAAGGMANLWGVLVVGSVLTFLSLRGCFGTFDDAVFGAMLILIVSFAPEGPFQPLARLGRALWRRLRVRADAGKEPPHGPA